MSKNNFWLNKFKTITKLAIFLFALAIAITACGSQSLGDDNGSEAGERFVQESNEIQNSDRQPLDLSEAADKLDVSENELAEALGKSPPPDLEATAEKLGVSVEELKDALPPPPGRSPQ